MTLNQLLADMQTDFLRYARAVCHDEEEARDLLQSALCRAMSTRHPPADRHKARSWMYRIIRNLHIDELRRAKLRRDYQASHGHLAEASAKPPDMAEIMNVRLAFERLPAPKREILYLVDMAGMSYQETAEIMDIPQGTVMSRISRARQAMIHLLDRGVK